MRQLASVLKKYKNNLVASCSLIALQISAQPSFAQNISFSPLIDRRIVEASVAPTTPCELQQLEETTQAKDDAWSAWQTDYCALNSFLINPTYPGLGSYAVPVRLPNSAGRYLFIAGYSPVVLLEFASDRFRFIELGTGDSEGSPTVSHQFYPHPEGDLLRINAVTGEMGKAGGALATWLSIFDLTQGKWVLTDLLVGVQEELGANNSHEATRFYQIQDGGRTLVVGNYRLDAGPYRYPSLPPAVNRPEGAGVALPAGTYRLLAGFYQRVSLNKNILPVPASKHKPKTGRGRSSMQTK